jgi:hypothetical protein
MKPYIPSFSSNFAYYLAFLSSSNFTIIFMTCSRTLALSFNVDCPRSNYCVPRVEALRPNFISLADIIDIL